MEFPQCCIVRCGSAVRTDVYFWECSIFKVAGRKDEANEEIEGKSVLLLLLLL